MDKVTLGKTLRELRAKCEHENVKLSNRIIDSIENANAQYSAKKLIDYLNGIKKTAVIYIPLVDERYEIHTALDFHKAIERMMAVYGESPHSVATNISVNYTPPKDGVEHLSIDTLLVICKYCESKLLIE